MALPGGFEVKGVKDLFSEVTDGHRFGSGEDIDGKLRVESGALVVLNDRMESLAIVRAVSPISERIHVANSNWINILPVHLLMLYASRISRKLTRNELIMPERTFVIESQSGHHIQPMNSSIVFANVKGTHLRHRIRRDWVERALLVQDLARFASLAKHLGR